MNFKTCSYWRKRMDSTNQNSALSDVTSILAVVFLFVIGQWTTYQCVARGREVFQPQIGIETPLIILLMECVTLLIFLKITTDPDTETKTEGIIVCFLCHFLFVFMTGFCFFHSKGKPSESITYLAPLLAIALNFICKGLKEPFPKILSSGLLSFGAILFANTGFSVFDSDSVLLFIVMFSRLLRNFCLKNFQSQKTRISLRVNIICTYISVLMLSIFVVSLVGNKVWTSFVILGLFSAMISSVTIYVISEHILSNQSVLFLSVLNVYGELIIRMLFVDKSTLPYVPYLLLGAAMACGGTILFLKTNFLDCDISLGPIEKNENKSPVSNNEFYTRIEFLLFAGSVIGLFVYILEPRVSARDMNTLKYVGLDGLIRKLRSLSNDVETD